MVVSVLGCRYCLKGSSCSGLFWSPSHCLSWTFPGRTFGSSLPKGTSMPKAKQFSVSVENRPGTLAHVARVLGDAKVNILAFLTTTSNTEGAVHVVVEIMTPGNSPPRSTRVQLILPIVSSFPVDFVYGATANHNRIQQRHRTRAAFSRSATASTRLLSPRFSHSSGSRA